MTIDRQKLRTVIQESMRVQANVSHIPYIDINNALADMCAKANHVVYGRRGCGKTLLLKQCQEKKPADEAAVYLNCEEFKKHSYPNVLVVILKAVFEDLVKQPKTWRHPIKAYRSNRILKKIMKDLELMLETQDVQVTSVVETKSMDIKDGFEVGLAYNGAKAKGAVTEQTKSGVEKGYSLNYKKDELLDRKLPSLKKHITEYFKLQKNANSLLILLDDFYHLKRDTQPLIADFVHRLCKDVPLYFKIATIRHASLLYVTKEGQPIGVQEGHDFQSINIDFTFDDFKRTERQILDIFHEYGKVAGIEPSEFNELFAGDSFNRLVLAGGGVPRDCLAVFLKVLKPDLEKITKDSIRPISLSGFDKRIQDMKEDSQPDEQASLVRGTYLVRKFCLERKFNMFLVSESVFQEQGEAATILSKLFDYRIIHSAGTAMSHKSTPGSYRVFMIDVGCYAHWRKTQDKIKEIDLMASDIREKMRSLPIITNDYIIGTEEDKKLSAVSIESEMIRNSRDNESVDDAPADKIEEQLTMGLDITVRPTK